MEFFFLLLLRGSAKVRISFYSFRVSGHVEIVKNKKILKNLVRIVVVVVVAQNDKRQATIWSSSFQLVDVFLYKKE